MGSFIGHAVPGIMFFLASIWWLIGALRRTFWYHKSFQRQPLLQRRQNNTTNLPQHRAVFSLNRGRTAKIPFEPIAKIGLCVIGVLGELLYEKQWVLIHNGFVDKHLNNYAHASMYCMFGLSGVVDLLMYYRVAPLPTGVDHLFLALAFFVEGMLFYFHLDGRPEISVRVHTFLYMTSFITCLILLAEMKATRALIHTFSRAFLTSLQGTWFFQVAFVLHGFERWENSRANIEFIAIAFVWHVLILASLYLVIFVVSYRVYCMKTSQGPQEINEDEATDDEFE
ncbi:transmembrane protein 45B-like [Exaiptasia diaphana]|uniref:Transmembrane protein 45B n=1 Tax=Exaiptasia diaphana TaxID=2652724 RepID=A0A913Y3W4_EXADI|nr:transmembrane protein 45B-like [Exaiptasia diaphana]